MVLLLLLAGLACGAEVKKVQITREQCAARHMAVLDLTLDATGTALIPFYFPEPGVYLRMSGPPGGPLQMEVLAKPSSLHEALDARFDGIEEQKPYRARLMGEERAGVTFLVGKSLARTRWAALELPHQVVLFGASPGADPVTHPHLAPLAASLKVTSP